MLEKLKNLNYLPNAHTQEVDRILVEKNQLQSEKNQIESKYKHLLLEFNNLKEKLKLMENKYQTKKILTMKTLKSY